MSSASFNSPGNALATRLRDACARATHAALPGARPLPVLTGMTPKCIFVEPLENVLARAIRLHPRQIGWLVAANHLAILIPCHRVVGKDGTLVGYGGGLAKKRWLLDHELRAAGVVLR